MSSENTLTGRDGYMEVDGNRVARITNWAVNPSALMSEWGDSDSGGYTNRAPGRKDCPFTAEGKFDTTDAIYLLFEEGDIAAVVLNLDAAGRFWNFPRAACIDFNLVVDPDTDEVIGWTSSWGSDGVYAHPTL